MPFIFCESTSHKVATTEAEAEGNNQHEQQKPSENVPVWHRQSSTIKLLAFLSQSLRTFFYFFFIFFVAWQTFERQKQLSQHAAG